MRTVGQVIPERRTKRLVPSFSCGSVVVYIVQQKTEDDDDDE